MNVMDMLSFKRGSLPIEKVCVLGEVAARGKRIFLDGNSSHSRILSILSLPSNVTQNLK